MKSITWQKVVMIRQDLLTSFIEATCYRRYHYKVFGISIDYGYKYIDGHTYYARQDREKIQKYIQKRGNKVIKKFINAIENQGNRFIKKTQRFCFLDYSQFSDDKLLLLFNQAMDYYFQMFSVILMPLEIESALNQLIRSKLEKIVQNNQAEVEKILSSISISYGETQTIKEKKQRLKIGALISCHKFLSKCFKNKNLTDIKQVLNKFPAIQKALYKHLKEFSWLGVMFLQGAPDKINDLIKNIRRDLKGNPGLELKKLISQQKKGRQKSKRILAQLKNHELKTNFCLLQKLIFIRTFRLEAINQGNFNIRDLLLELAKRLGLKYQQLIYLTKDEIEAMLIGSRKVKKNEINQRLKSYGITNRPRIQIFTGCELRKLLNEIESKVKQATQLKGRIAYKGLVKGKVKIIKDKTEINKIKKGEIMVTEMTTPDYVTAMENSAAIITDIGGITSHTAIISRELGIPCIIGTKIATKVLKDGDLVEVNANKGVVKVLKNEKV